jgi:hypothetical protein
MARWVPREILLPFNVFHTGTYTGDAQRCIETIIIENAMMHLGGHEVRPHSVTRNPLMGMVTTSA